MIANVDIKGIPVLVTCYSGYRTSERPIKFKYQLKEYFIDKIIDSSLQETSDSKIRFFYYRVLCNGGEEFSLIHVLQKGIWYLQ